MAERKSIVQVIIPPHEVRDAKIDAFFGNHPMFYICEGETARITNPVEVDLAVRYYGNANHHVAVCCQLCGRNLDVPNTQNSVIVHTFE